MREKQKVLARPPPPENRVTRERRDLDRSGNGRNTRRSRSRSPIKSKLMAMAMSTAAKAKALATERDKPRRESSREREINKRIKLRMDELSDKRASSKISHRSPDRKLRSEPVPRKKNITELDKVVKKARQERNPYWDKKVLEAEEKDPQRWGHSGFKELYHKDFKRPQPSLKKQRRSRSFSSPRRNQSPRFKKGSSRSRSRSISRRSRSRSRSPVQRGMKGRKESRRSFTPSPEFGSSKVKPMSSRIGVLKPKSQSDLKVKSRLNGEIKSRHSSGGRDNKLSQSTLKGGGMPLRGGNGGISMKSRLGRRVSRRSSSFSSSGSSRSRSRGFVAIKRPVGKKILIKGKDGRGRRAGGHSESSSSNSSDDDDVLQLHARGKGRSPSLSYSDSQSSSSSRSVNRNRKGPRSSSSSSMTDSSTDSDSDASIGTKPNNSISTRPNNSINTKPNNSINSKPTNAINTKPNSSINTKSSNSIGAKPINSIGAKSSTIAESRLKAVGKKVASSAIPSQRQTNAPNKLVAKKSKPHSDSDSSSSTGPTVASKQARKTPAVVSKQNISEVNKGVSKPIPTPVKEKSAAVVKPAAKPASESGETESETDSSSDSDSEPRMTLSERFAKLAQMSTDKREMAKPVLSVNEIDTKMRVVKDFRNPEAPKVYVTGQGASGTTDARSKIRPKTPDYSVPEGEKLYSSDERRRHFERMYRDEPAERPLDWSDARVRYNYYKERGCFDERPITLDEYVKWEDWYQKYREWLEREEYYSRMNGPQAPAENYTGPQYGGGRGGGERQRPNYPQGRRGDRMGGPTPLSNRPQFGRPDNNVYMDGDMGRRIDRTPGGSLVVNIRQGQGGPSSNNFGPRGRRVGMARPR